MEAPASPARRVVLGSKDANTPLRRQQIKQLLGSPELGNKISSGTPRKQHPSSSAFVQYTSPRLGQKRKMDDVNKEGLSDFQGASQPHPLSQVTDILSDTMSDIEEMAPPSLTYSKTTLTTSFASQGSYRPSQEEEPHIEPEFQLLEEQSQQAVDKMHAITFSQNQHTSQLLPALRPGLAKEASQVSLSMSSLIDFEDDRAFQDDDIEMIEDVEPAKEPTLESALKTEDELRRDMLAEKADILRTRLQLALYKVQTNQITRPFDRLPLPKARSSSPELPGSSPKSSSTLKASSIRNTVSMEDRVALARSRATAGPPPSVRPLSTLPVPSLAPTAFSARWNTNKARNTQPQPVDLPSSPPLSQEDDTAETHFRKRKRMTSKEPRTPQQLSSPIARNYEEDKTVRSRRFEVKPRALTSSVVKGEAANSLLDLVRNTRCGGAGMCGH